MSGLDRARAVADAVLYEGYLLYPYRATSSKNQVRWQFGVVGPAGAAADGTGEESFIEMQTVVRAARPDAVLALHLRFLQLQRRRTEQRRDDGGFVEVPELTVGASRLLAWDEAVEVEQVITASLAELSGGIVRAVDIHPGRDVEELVDDSGGVPGRLVRERRHLQATVTATLEPAGSDGLAKLTVRVDNRVSAGGRGRDEVQRHSLVGTHLLLDLADPGCGFVSVIDPPEDAAQVASTCRQQRCWPVLAGETGDDSLLLGSPIILYDHPEIAEESSVALFDSTEIDEILTLRVLTMTDEEKAEARATDPRAAEIVERCEQMSPQDMQRLHGVLRDPFGADPFGPSDTPAETAGVDVDPFGPDPFGPELFGEDQDAVDPEQAVVVIAGVSVSKGSRVRIHPNRRADAQDLFFADQVARVTAVQRDFDGDTHVAVVLVDDPAADLHDWYGRYLYFAPDEIEPLADVHTSQRKESSS